MFLSVCISPQIYVPTCLPSLVFLIWDVNAHSIHLCNLEFLYNLQILKMLGFDTFPTNDVGFLDLILKSDSHTIFIILASCMFCQAIKRFY